MVFGFGFFSLNYTINISSNWTTSPLGKKDGRGECQCFYTVSIIITSTEILNVKTTSRG